MKCSTTFVCGCMMAVCAPSWAADYTWMSSPADALWNTTSLNWNSGEAWVDGNNAIFGSSSSKTVTLGGNRTAADITVNGYTFNGPSALSWTGTMTVSGTTSIYAPLADSGNGLRFAPSAHVFLYGSNTHTGGTYVGGSDDKAFGLSAGDAALGPIPATPQANVIAMGNKYATFYVTVNTELNANRHFLIEDGAWLGFAGQGRPTFRIKGEIHGEILAGQSYPTTTHLKSHWRSDWLSHVILDPGAGHTNDVGTLSSLGWLEIASGASLHTAAPSLAGGFLSYRGLRIGVCGEAAISGGCLLGFRRLHALAVRIPQPCSRACLETASQALAEGPLNTLISAPPGVGKTSLLRELIRAASGRGYRVGVIDERKELAGDEENESLGPCSDVLSGLDKARAAMILLRGMNPQIIAMDEITRSGDAETVKDITGCGVAIFATAHGSSPEDMRGRRLYRELLDGGLFQQLICISLRAGERVYDRRLL